MLLSRIMEWFCILSLLFYVSGANTQLTAISLSPPNTFIKDTQLGNRDLSKVLIEPVTSITNCFVNGARSASNMNVQHPFTLRFTATPSTFEWHVIFDATSQKKLNAATVPFYQLTVECREQNISQSAAMTIQVLPNQRPVIANYPGLTRSYNAESVRSGTSLYTVTATDGDGDPLTYSYVVQPTVNYFDINTATNEIRSAVDFRSATMSPIIIHVNVSDGFSTVTDFKLRIQINGELSPLVKLRIQINGLNERPDITNLPATQTVREDIAGGTTILNLQYLDLDFIGNFVPTCTVFPNTQPSIISVNGNRLSLATSTSGKNVLDFESVTSYNVTCTISDGFLTSQGDVMTINVQNVNEKPVFNQQTYTCLLEESKAGVSTCNLFLTATDPEGDAVIVSIRPGNNSQRFVFVSPAYDILSFAVDYDVDRNAMPSNVVIEVEARDTGGQVGVANIAITILDKNDNSPTFPAISPVIDISDITDIGIIDIVLATDDDSGSNGEVVYEANGISPPTAANYISVLPNGQIHFTKRFPDSLKGTAVLLTVEAKDKGSPPKSASTSRTIRFLESPLTTGTTSGSLLPSQNSAAATQQESYFDEPANIALVVILSLILLAALILAFYFCMKYMLLGYCCKPGPNRPSRVHPVHDDYDPYNSYYRTPYSRDPRYPREFGDPRYTRGEYGDPREYRDPRYYRNPNYPLSAGSINGDFYDDRSYRGSRKAQLAIQPY